MNGLIRVTLLLVATVLLLADWSSEVLGQTRNQTLERIQYYRDVGRLMRQMRPFITEAKNREAAFSQIEPIGSLVEDHLAWTGDRGALIEVRIERLKNQDIPITAVIGDPVLVGFGDAPAEVLAVEISKPRVLPGPRDGFEEWNDGSFFLWAEPKDYWLGLRNTLHVGLIPPELSSVVRAEAIKLDSETSLKNALVSRRKAAILEHSIEKLARDAQDLDYAARLRKAQQRIIENRGKITNIEAQLQSDLDQLNKVNDVHRRFGQLKNVIDISVFVLELSAVAPEKQDDLNDIRDEETLGWFVREYEEEKNGIILRRRESIELLKNEASEDAVFLKGELSAAKAPTEVIEATEDGE